MDTGFSRLLRTIPVRRTCSSCHWQLFKIPWHWDSTKYTRCNHTVSDGEKFRNSWHSQEIGRQTTGHRSRVLILPSSRMRKVVFTRESHLYGQWLTARQKTSWPTWRKSLQHHTSKVRTGEEKYILSWVTTVQHLTPVLGNLPTSYSWTETSKPRSRNWRRFKPRKK